MTRNGRRFSYDGRALTLMDHGVFFYSPCVTQLLQKCGSFF